VSEAWSEPEAPGAVDELDAEALLQTLRRHSVEFVLIGGLAVAAHGYVRATDDVDVVPKPERENRRRLYEAMKTVEAQPVELGDFRPEELPVPFSPEGLDEGGNWALRTRAGRIDVLQWVSGIESFEELHARAVEVDLPGVGAVLVAGYEDLLAMKRAAGRPVDERDIAALEDVRRALDR
jgi:hypothetical protein